MTFSTPPCSSSGDEWNYSTGIGIISPNDGAQFWGIADLNGDCGGTSFETITLPNVDVSLFTGVTFSFDYNAFEFDNGDDFKYELFFDNVGQGEVLFFNGTSNLSTSGWETISVSIPGSVTNVSVVLYAKQNGGGDYGGFDNVILEGTSTCTPATIASVSPTSAAEGATVTITASSGDLTGGSVSFNGLAATITSSNTTTIVCTVPTGATSGDLTIIDAQPCTTTYSTFTVTCGPTTEPTISATSLSFSGVNCDEFTINWTNGNGAKRVVIMSTLAITGVPIDQNEYNANANYGSGATIVAGEYFVYNGTGNSVSVTGLTANTNYFVAVFEYNGTISNCNENYLITPSLTGSQTSTLTCASTCPQVKSILVNACGVSSNEGLDEYIVFKNGSSSLPINDIEVTFPNPNGTYCNTTCGTKTIGNNPTYISSLNAAASCTKFAYVDPIPANATVILFTGQTPSYVYDFSSMCGGSEQVIALFCSNTSGGGRYGNSSNANRSTTMVWGSCSQTATFYSSSANTGTDGDFANFDAIGAVSYSNSGACLATPLPAELNYFEVTKSDRGVQLNWETWSEVEANHFEIFKSDNGIDYEILDEVKANGYSNQIIKYSTEDSNPFEGLSYYRLDLVNFNYERETLGYVTYNNNDAEVSVVNYENHWLVNHSLNEGVINVYNMNGVLLKSESILDFSTRLSNLDFTKGVYIVELKSKDNVWTNKVVK